MTERMTEAEIQELSVRRTGRHGFVEVLCSKAHAEIMAQRAEIAELKAALMPFGNLGEVMLPIGDGDDSIWATCPDETPVNNIAGHAFTFGDFRQAARLCGLPEVEE